MDGLISLINDNENWLVDTVIEYAKSYGYAKYASTLNEAWRISIADLSSSLIEYYEINSGGPCLGSNESFKNDVLTSFGITEAKRYRERGVSLSVFLGLMKTYKQSYIDLVRLKCNTSDRMESYRLFFERCFDHIEIAFCQEWTQSSQSVLISELRAINRLMTNEKNVYLTLFESQFDPTIILNQANEIVNINHAAAKLIDPKYQPGEIYYQWIRPNRGVAKKKRQHLAGSVIGSRIEVYFPWIERILAERCNDATCRINCEIRLADAGDHAYYEITCSPILDISDYLRGSILTLRDITDRKNTEEALKQSHEDLEKRVEERTADLKAINDKLALEVEERKRIETSLIQAKEEAESANRVKSDFIANMSHELRTPLNGIFLLIDILQEASLEDQQIKYLQMANKSSQTLMSLLNDLLNFSNIKERNYETESIEFNLKTILKSAISDQLPLLLEKRLGLKFEVQETLPEIFRGDPGRLRQVLINLLNNAIKYTEHGQIVIRALIKEPLNTPVVLTEQEKAPELMFSISDTGIGIPENKLGKIFEMFTQVDESYCRLHGGAGLGLSICREYVHMMGGRIWCESKPGFGSTFFFTVRVATTAPVVDGIGTDTFLKGRPLSSDHDNIPSTPINHRIHAACDPLLTKRNKHGCLGLSAHSAPDDGMEKFLSEAPGEMEKLKTIWSTDNLVSIENQTAILRKLASNIGAEQLKKSLFRIELACRREDRRRISELKDAVMDSFEHVMGSLKKFKVSHMNTTERAICES